MRTKRISIISLIAAAVVAFSLALLGGAKLTLANTDPVFAFESGAYVKLSEDGGLRFRLQMDENTATEIKANAEETLYFYVASAERMAEVTDGEGAKALFTAGNAWEVEVDKAKIYAGKDGEGAADGYYYANVLLDINTLGASNGAYYTTDFVAAATLFDGNEYTSFVKSVNRSLQETASAGALRGGFYEEIAETYAWLGTEYPMVAKTAEDYQALLSAADIDSLYYVLDGVEDTEGLAETYGTAMISGGAANGIQYSDYAGYYQSWAALTTDLPVGTAVEVEMDVFVTGSFDGECSAIQAVDTVWSNAGGEANEGANLLAAVTGESGWHTISFAATVRDYNALRLNLAYKVLDTSGVGNAVYIVADHRSVKAFNYKNVVISPIYSMAAGSQKITGANGFYHAAMGIPTDLELNTAVTVSMDIKITGTVANAWVNSRIINVDSVNAGDKGVKAYADLYAAPQSGAPDGWLTLTFDTAIRSFSGLTYDTAFPVVDTGSVGNGIYLCAYNFKSAASFVYKNLTITSKGYKTLASGGANSVGNGFYQSYAGLTTDLPVGTAVEVQMDVNVTGSFNEWSGVYAVDSLYSDYAANGKVVISSVTAESGWHTITFTATVRNFDRLTFSSQYAVQDTSTIGNAVYIMTQNPSVAAFNYRNVTISAVYAMQSGGANTTGNGYYQTLTGIKTNLAVGTSVTVEMDVKVTGLFDNQYCYVDVVTGVWSTSGGESKGEGITSLIVTGDTGWHHVTFTATVLDLACLRNNTQYPVVDTSDIGKAVYIITQNRSADSFSYKNVTITAN